MFLQGVIVNLLNPHTALFFFAFLPQFVEPSRGGVAFQMSEWAIAAGTAAALAGGRK